MARKKDKQKKSRPLAALALWGFAGVVLIVVYFGYDLPAITDVKPLEQKPSITVLAADNSLIARYGGLKGDVVALKDLPPDVGHAVLAIEDRRFYKHPGIDVVGLGRAMWVNARAGRWVQGGSTLTQQLAKNLFLTSDKTIRRKVQEALMALYIEHKFTKDDILEAYLNRVYFGSGAYGVDAAARTYFSKPARNLTLWESAELAGLLKAPSRFSPASSPELARDRAKTVIKAMEEAGYITEKREKSEMQLANKAVKSAAPGGLNRYFSDWVVNQIDSYVGDITGDIVVRTTLRPQLQSLAESNAKAFFKTLKPEDRISQMALVTLAKDGAVLAMIGGTDYAQSQFNRATQGERQPGSSFKPFVYLAALEAGFNPEDHILDAPFTSGSYRPDNYENKYFGDVTLTFALAHSLNTATIRLLSEVGVERMLDVASRAGFSEKFKPELATGLGADETNLLDLTNAYAVIANGGQGVWPYALISIEDTGGRIYYRRDSADFTQVFSPHDIAQLDGMLEQVVAQGTGMAAQLSRGHVAGKTGTTQNYRDAWFVGYTDRLVTGIWMGNDDGAAMNRVSGGKYPARLWHDYMNAAINLDLPAPRTGGLIGAAGDSFSGLLNRLSGDGNFTGDDTPVYNH